MKRVFILLCLLGCLLGLGAAPAAAGLPPAPAQPTDEAAALAAFMPVPGPIDLRGAHARAQLAIPIPAGIEAQRLTLHLAAANSVALQPRRSVLRVLFNDALVAQIPLDPQLPRIEAAIDLPVQGLRAGYHRLSFDVAQHYTEQCEDPAAAELWTQIDTRRSWLSLQARWQDGLISLAELDRLFDPRRWGPARLTIASVGPATPEIVRLGALASQTAALHLRYRPLQVGYHRLAPQPQALAELMQQPAGSGPVILLGTPQQLASLLGEDAPPPSGSRLSLRLWPTRPDRPLLVVQGTATEMEQALRALLTQRTPLPDRAEAGIRAVSAAPAPQRLPPDRPIRLRDLGWNDDLAVVGRYGSRGVEFDLPADFYTPRADHLSLRLNLAYGAGLRADSALNVLVNGRFAQAVPLDARGGARYDGYEVRIPLALLQPGRNHIELSAHLLPAESGHCLEQAAGQLRLSVRADSSLRLPPHARVAAVPELRLFARSAYPYAEASSLGLWLGEADAHSLGAAWTLLARLAQTRGAPLPELRIGLGKTPPQGMDDLILIGAPPQFPPAALKPAPLSAQGRILHGLGARSTELAFNGWRDWLAWLTRGVPAAEADAAAASVTVQGAALGRQAALMQWLGEDGRLNTWLAADRSELLPALTGALIEPMLWERMQGDVLVWRDAESAHSDRVGATALRGGAGWWMRLSYLFSQRPVYWAVAGLVALLLAWSTYRLLLRFKARRHAAVREGD